MKTLIAGVFLALLTTTAFSQSNSIRFNANYLLSQTPVFSLGFEHQLDSTHFSWNLALEGGQYQLLEETALFSTISGESVKGLAIIPELRYYFGDQLFHGNFGVFATSFARLGRFKNQEQQGVLADDEGFNIDSPEIQSTLYYRSQWGVGLGYRSGCHANRLHLEGLVGYYLLGKAPISQDSTRPVGEQMNINAQKIRIELNLVILI